MAAATSSAATNMEPSVERHALQQPMQMRQYQGYSVRSVPLDRRADNGQHGPGPLPPVRQREDVEEEADEEQEPDAEDDEEEEEDQNLMQQMRLPPPVPPPSQLERFQRYLKVGFFVASVEVLIDRGNEDVEKIRKYAHKKVKKLIDSTGEVCQPEIPGRPICGTPRIKRDLKRMSKHLEFFNGLFIKIVEDYDGSPLRLSKLRIATGFIKGVMALDKRPVYNIMDRPPARDIHDIELEIFKYNAGLFLQYLQTYQNQ